MLSQKLLVLFFGLGTAAWQQCINAASASSHLASVKENPNTWENKGFVEANFSSMPEPVVNDPDCHVGLLVYQSYNTPNDTNLLASGTPSLIVCKAPSTFYHKQKICAALTAAIHWASFWPSFPSTL